MFRLTNVIPERIILVSRGITVYIHITTNNIPSNICLVSQFREHCLALKCPEIYGNMESNNAWSGSVKFRLSRNAYLVTAREMSTFPRLSSSGRLHHVGLTILKTEDLVWRGACLSQIWLP